MKSLVASLVLVLLVVIGSLGLVGHLAFNTPHPASGRDLAIEAATWPAFGAAPSLPRTALPTSTPIRTSTPPPAPAGELARLPSSRATLPRVTPARETVDAFEAWSAPASLPTATAPPPGACDPAYPEERTCIPPGPPLAQGCAITDQRLFAVLPPDPQRLDSDEDGIGCEPI